MVELAIGRDPEVPRVLVAAYRVASGGGEGDPDGGRTTLYHATVARSVRLGQMLAKAGRAEYEHGISPGPVVTFTGGSRLLDLRFGDPDEDARAVEAIAQGFEELGLSVGEGSAGSSVVSGGS